MTDVSRTVWYRVEYSADMVIAGPSPFVFDGPVSPDQVIDRDDEIAAILAWGKVGRFVSLYAPRRYGKTSLLGKVAKVAWDQRQDPGDAGRPYGLASFADLVVRLERAYRDRAQGPFRRAVEAVLRRSRLGLSLAGAGISLTFAERPSVDPLPALHALLDLPAAVADRYERRVIVVFDEFQAVLAVNGLEAILRSHVQHQRAVASYVFAGSEPSLLDAVFADRARPFFGQAEPFRLGRLPARAARRRHRGRLHFRPVGSRVTPSTRCSNWPTGTRSGRCCWRTACGWRRLLAGLPGRTRGNRRWPRCGAAPIGSARRCGAGWATTSGGACRAVVRFGSPYRREAQRMLGLAKSSAQTAVERLVKGGDLEREDDSLRVIDPLLADWIGRRFP